MEQHGLPGLPDKVARIVAGGAIHTETDRYTCIPHCAYRRDAGAEAAVGTGAMRDTRRRLREKVDLIAVELDAMGMPNI